MAEQRWKLEHYERLKEAIATGAASIRFKDKETRYRPAKEMKGLLAEMETDLGISAAKKRPRVRVPRFNNGL